MPTPDLLLLRLNEIASALQHSGHGLALIGLGSVGQELDRLDEYSDLDFFAIVEDGYKRRYIDELDWLAQVHPLAYNFQNSPDGHKLLFADGVFCEFAVFELAELPGIAFAPGRVVWQRQDAPDNLASPGRPPPAASQHSTEWLLGEALTNLYVGMGRYLRGEKLSAQRFIQHYAVDRLLELVGLIEAPRTGLTDAFAGERRFEQRFPGLAGELEQFIQGYQRSPQSARGILAFLERYFELNPAMRQAILALCNQAEA